MINSITGILTEKSEHSVYIQNGGIEWELPVSQETLSHLPQVGTEIRIFTHLHHKEDSMKLFGFYSKKERSLFLDLIKVNGVGTGLAIRILSGMSFEAFIDYLDKSDEVSLSKIPGLGKKTAQKIILTLRGKINLESKEAETVKFKDIIDGLADMGFDRRKAADAIAELSKEFPGDVEDERYEKELFRLGIQRLSS